MNNRLRVALSAGLAGVICAILMNMLTSHFVAQGLTFQVTFNKTRLLFWPTSILLMTDPQNAIQYLPIVAIMLNGILYGLGGYLLYMAVCLRGLMLVPVTALFFAWFGALAWIYSM